MRVRQFAAKALGDQLAAAVQLGQPPMILDAPPSALSEYPGLAVWIEHADLAISNDDDVTDDAGNTIVLQPGTSLSQIGSMRCKGRLWVGSRYPAKREELEESVWLQFFADRGAPTRLNISLAGCTLGPYTIPLGIGTFMIEGSDWTGEHAFEARIWSWIIFTMDAPLLVPRHEPIPTQMLLALSRDLGVNIAQPTDLAKLIDLQTITVTQDSP